MDTIEAIHSRRSIRKYTDKKVDEDKVLQIIEAAMMAPSAGNAQPWQFIVVRDKKTLSCIKDVNSYAQMAENSQVGILVCGDLSLEKYEGFWVQDCSAATQNLLLAAHSEGLAAVWTGIYPIKDRVSGFKKMFNLPEHVIPLAFIPIGYPDQTLKSKSRFSQEKVHKETW